jgi:methionine-rich copper-binding protein CopC
MAGIAAGLALLPAALIAAVAHAHAELISSEPAAAARLAQAPAALKLSFSQSIVPSGSFVHVETSAGTRLAVQAQFDETGRRTMSVPLPSLGPDLYRVRWQTLSADDDDYADGTYDFVVLNQDGSLPAAAAGTNGSPGAPTSSGGGGSSLGIVVAAGVAIVMVAGALVFVLRGRRVRV